MSSLQQAGFAPQIVTYRPDPEPLIELAEREHPVVIGFSLIFQYMAPDFARVIAALREHRVVTHLTMGGHYPSFDYQEILDRIPGLDSVVRFEGEATVVELASKIRSGEDWRQVHGIAYRETDRVIANSLRLPIADLDSLPEPYRDDIDYESQPFPVASILGSRGCPWECSFCSIRPFYEAQGGSLRRLRHPEAIAEEIAGLYHRRKVSLFLFQDDDFLGGGKGARVWAYQLAQALEHVGLAGKIAFKISCRSDEVREDILRRLMQVGLTHIYMGVESGDEQGLLNMNKHLQPAQHTEAGRILKTLGLTFDFGFMLLDPYSDFNSVRNNIAFLEAFAGDGWTAVSFCRMLPYAGTPIKGRLENDGRLLGTAFDPDYRFLDPKLDVFYEWMLATFHERNFTNRGLVHILRSLLFEAHLRMPGYGEYDDASRAYLHHLTAISNGVACYSLRNALDYIENKSLVSLQSERSFLQRLTEFERVEEQKLLRQVIQLYWPILERKRRSQATHEENMLIGSFDNTWTLAPVSD
jgi:radical SAM superfamily enzyme YgiQ (UPF0313 family)